MTIVTFSRQASIDEMAAEIDRRGVVIERLEAEIARLSDLFPTDAMQEAGAQYLPVTPYGNRKAYAAAIWTAMHLAAQTEPGGS